MSTTISGTSGITSANVATTIYQSGANVGIGTSSPVGNLHLYADGTNLDIQTSNNANYQKIRFKGAGGAIGGQVSGIGGTGGLIFYQATTEAMRIDSSGNLLVGTTGIPNGTSNYGSGFISTTNSRMVLQLATSSTASNSLVAFYNPNGTVGSISTSASATTYSTSSDYRLKENIQPMQNALATVAQLNPVTYTWKADGSDGQGFIAHELQAVVPDCVTGEKDAVDAEGNPVYQGIDTSFLVATLTKAIQELSAKNDALEARIAALEAK